MPPSPGDTEQAIDPAVAKTHQALFDTWFPLADLPIPAPVKPDVAAIAKTVSAAMLQAFSQSGVAALLVGMTVPSRLPFYACLQQSTDPAVKSFLASAGGYGGMPPSQRVPLFSFFFEGTCPGTAQVAMQLREVYLSGIWDLPLAVPLTEIESPTVFMGRPDIYAKLHAPAIPRSRLRYDSAAKRIVHQDGPIQCLVIGSGPGGATVAYECQRARLRTVLVEKGPFVVWGSMDTRSYPRLMFEENRAATADNGIVIRSGEAMGGGSTVNIDLAFSPLEATVQARIEKWREEGLIDAEYYTPERISAAYEWVRKTIKTRELSQAELNRDNLVLWNGAKAFGIDPSLYHLNRFPQNESPSPVDDKRDAARQLVVPAMTDAANPLSVIPDATVDEVLFSQGPDPVATGVQVTFTSPWTDYGNTIVDPCGLGIPPGTTVTIDAENVVLAAGTIGTTRILLNTANRVPAVKNPHIGEGLILHPSLPLIGQFDEDINLLEGLDSATFVAAFGVTPGFIYETMSGLPAYGALLIPGDGRQVYEALAAFNRSAGFGVMLVDTPSPSNRITLDAQGDPVLTYALSDYDRKRFQTGVAIAIRMMFLAGAKKVIIPSNENFLNQSDFDPMRGVYLTSIDQADLVEQNLQFVPNRTLLTSAHLQATNKMGPSPEVAVVSTNQRVWDMSASADRPREVPNLYVMDSSMFPTSVGANPMQSLYTFARIFSERFILTLEGTPPSAPAIDEDAASSPLQRAGETAVAPQPESIGPKSG
jgi:GMC oxidoreductase